MKVLLIYPPVWDASQPFLSIPSLTAFLRENGHEVIQKDLNLEFQDTVLNPDYLMKLLQRRTLKEAGNLKELIPMTLSSLVSAKNILRSKDYYNPELYVKAKSVIEAAYYIFSNFYTPTVITGKNFQMRYDSSSSIESVSATHDRNENPFIDFYEENFLAEFKEINPGIVGISLTSRSQLIPALTLCRLLKLENPDIHITLGGSLVSKLIPGLKNLPHLFSIFFDSWVSGEGERPLLELVQAIETGSPLSEVGNLTYFDGQQVIHNPDKPPIPANDLPTPDFEGMPLEKYLIGDLVLPLLASRGCYWRKCSFCDLYHVHGISYQRRKTEKIIEDLKVINEKHGVRYFSFEDEAVTAKTANAIADAVIESGLDIRWRFQARLEKQFSKEVCEKLYKSGARMLFFGLESASERVLRLMEKGIKIHDILKIYDNTSKAGIWTYSYLIFGFPSETREEAMQTIDFITTYSNIIDASGPSIFSLVKGSPASVEPEKYMIKSIKERFLKDWEIYLDYDPVSGMKQSEAAQMYGIFIKSLWDKGGKPIWMIFGQEVAGLLYADKYGYSEFKNMKYPFQDNRGIPMEMPYQ